MGKHVNSEVFTTFPYSNIKKTQPVLLLPCFQQTGTIFKLGQDILRTNFLSSFMKNGHKMWLLKGSFGFNILVYREKSRILAAVFFNRPENFQNQPKINRIKIMDLVSKGLEKHVLSRELVGFRLIYIRTTAPPPVIMFFNGPDPNDISIEQNLSYE